MKNRFFSAFLSSAIPAYMSDPVAAAVSTAQVSELATAPISELATAQVPTVATAEVTVLATTEVPSVATAEVTQLPTETVTFAPESATPTVTEPPVQQEEAAPVAPVAEVEGGVPGKAEAGSEATSSIVTEPTNSDSASTIDEAPVHSHKTVLEGLLEDLEGAQAMAKSEIIAIVDEARKKLDSVVEKLTGL